MTVPVDELVARLARVRDEEVGTAPGGPGGRGLLAEIIAAAPCSRRGGPGGARGGSRSPPPPPPRSPPRR
ncbi:hypothetical protein ACFQHO_38205 [Actinomadura yumaensis]|uniref:hypothetical protein n=1 Tax=Actinomadura yumaensis TaxID=111807 RepID=UPI0036215E38